MGSGRISVARETADLIKQQGASSALLNLTT
jgi:hypothetical protein